ncbi:MAG TPA: FG-GAP repeat protein [Phycisphaerae bacterium]|nr:FG-GAP repeat protein [Phycisphaerae bacterium]
MDRHLHPVTLCFAAFCLTLPIRAARAQCTFNQVAKITTPDVGTTAYFGNCDSDGDFLVVGAKGASTAAGTWAGAAFIFQKSADVWNQVAILTPDDSIAFDWFGASVAIEGDTVVVGSPQHDAGAGADSGAAYVFRLTNGVWSQTARLLASNSHAGAQFGSDVRLNNGVIVIGAPFAQGPFGDAGAVYVFGEDAGVWGETAKLVSNDGASGDEFGSQSCLRADSLIVGAPAHDADGAESGSAYVFLQSNGVWSQAARLTPDEPLAGDHFGTSVFIENDSIVVGAPNHPVAPYSNRGAAMLFERIGGDWIQSAVLTQPTTICGAFMGRGVFMRDGAIFANAQCGPTRESTGAIVAFRMINGDWRQTNVFASTDASSYDKFSLYAISGDYLFCGSIEDDDLGQESGAAYVFAFGAPAPDCNSNGVADDCEIGSDLIPDCNENGVPDDCDIADATESDCNGNGIPDACEVANESVSDCNENGVPDTCDVDNGTSCDNNANGELDECEYLSRITSEVSYDSAVFGISVGLSGDVAIVGDSGFRGEGTNNGGVFVFDRIDDRWARTDIITQPDTGAPGEPYTSYGSSLAIQGNRAVIGARRPQTPRRVAAFLIEYSDGAWSQRTLWEAPSASTITPVQSLDMTEDTIAIGATNYGFTGTAVVFRYVNGDWTQVAELIDPEGLQNDDFARSVSISGAQILVGASKDDDMAPDAGTVHLFQEVEGAWELVDKLHGDTNTTPDRGFGYSVACDGDVAVVGAPGGPGTTIGAAYVFRKIDGVWVQESRFSSAIPSDGYGRSVAIDGRRIVVGAPLDNPPGTPAGAAYVYTYRSGAWQFDGKRIPAENPGGGTMGMSVAVDNGNVLVGSPLEVDVLTVRGAVYTYDLTKIPVDCNGNDIPDDCEPPLRTIADFASALVDASNDPFDVCVFDADDDGLLDSRDIQPFILRLIGE